MYFLSFYSILISLFYYRHFTSDTVMTLPGTTVKNLELFLNTDTYEPKGYFLVLPKYYELTHPFFFLL